MGFDGAARIRCFEEQIESSVLTGIKVLKCALDAVE